MADIQTFKVEVIESWSPEIMSHDRFKFCIFCNSNSFVEWTENGFRMKGVFSFRVYRGNELLEQGMRNVVWVYIMNISTHYIWNIVSGLTSSDVVMVQNFGIVFYRLYLDKNCTSVTSFFQNRNSTEVLLEQNSVLWPSVCESSMLDYEPNLIFVAGLHFLH
jgi:hypothetical protein